MDISHLTMDTADDADGYAICVEECVATMQGSPCKADHIACNPKAWSIESQFATCLLPKCQGPEDCPIPAGTTCWLDGDCDTASGEYCWNNTCVFEGDCDTTSGLCSWEGDPQAEIGDPCQRTADCPDDSRCVTESVDDQGKTVAANGYCTRYGCNAANAAALNGSGSSEQAVEDRYGCGVLGTCYSMLRGGGACLRRCDPEHIQPDFKCRQATWDEAVEDQNGDYDCYDMTMLGYYIYTSGNTEIYEVCPAPLCAWVAESFTVYCGSANYEMDSGTCSMYFGGNLEMDMICRDPASGEHDENGYCLDVTTSGPTEGW